MSFRAGLIQLTSGDDPAANLLVTLQAVREAAVGGADLILTPEVTNCVSTSRARQLEVLQTENDDLTLAALCAEARALGRWVLVGSLALKTDDPDGRFANRSFLIGPDGTVTARYDKIHMFDVRISADEVYRESAGYRPGERAVVADMGGATLGLTICYDIRFPLLYRRLAQAGAQVLTVPSAFSPVTGAAHWESLLRARAIETGCFVLAPAQCGTHNCGRRTHGHSMAISPWGEILADGGTEPGVTLVDIDIAQVADARAKLPGVTQDAAFSGP